MKSGLLVTLGACALRGLLCASAETPVNSTATFVPPKEMRVSWGSVAGESYQLRSTTRLDGVWAPYATDPAVLVAQGGNLEVKVPVAEAARFFRVVKLDPQPPPAVGDVLVHSTATFIPPRQVRVSWRADAGGTYEVQTTTRIRGDWTAYASDPALFAAHGGDLDITIPAVDAVRFFRVVKRAGTLQPVAGMVPIPAGTFTMGSPPGEVGRNADEGPQTHVTLTKAFWLGRHKVTQAEYQSVLGVNPSNWVGEDLPVERVSWNDAVAYCEQLTQREREAGRLPPGWEYRLPTEAQWEYACRAGTTTRFSFGDADADLGKYAWYDANSSGRTHPVGQKSSNPWGLSDLHGDVWEWCADLYGPYRGGSVTDPTGLGTGFYRVVRGGAWNTGARDCRSAVRDWYFPLRTYRFIGFRVALVPVS